jgi:hypothetical protein
MASSCHPAVSHAGTILHKQKIHKRDLVDMQVLMWKTWIRKSRYNTSKEIASEISIKRIKLPLNTWYVRRSVICIINLNFGYSCMQFLCSCTQACIGGFRCNVLCYRRISHYHNRQCNKLGFMLFFCYYTSQPWGCSQERTLLKCERICLCHVSKHQRNLETH